MALTELIVANLALARIGSDQLTALLSEKSDIGLEDIFDYTRDELLQYFPWKFAVARSELAQAALTGSNVWDFKYPIPADSLRVLEVESSTADEAVEPRWEIEEANIVTNEESATDKLQIRYIKQITDVTKWTMDFLNVFTILLASRIVIPISNDKALESELLAEFANELINAYLANTAIGTPYVKSRVEKVLDERFVRLQEQRSRQDGS